MASDGDLQRVVGQLQGVSQQQVRQSEIMGGQLNDLGRHMASLQAIVATNTEETAKLRRTMHETNNALVIANGLNSAVTDLALRMGRVEEQNRGRALTRAKFLGAAAALSAVASALGATAFPKLLAVFK